MSLDPVGSAAPWQSASVRRGAQGAPAFDRQPSAGVHGRGLLPSRHACGGLIALDPGDDASQEVLVRAPFGAPPAKRFLERPNRLPPNPRIRRMSAAGT